MLRHLILESISPKEFVFYCIKTEEKKAEEEEEEEGGRTCQRDQSNGKQVDCMRITAFWYQINHAEEPGRASGWMVDCCWLVVLLLASDSMRFRRWIERELVLLIFIAYQSYGFCYLYLNAIGKT